MHGSLENLEWDSRLPDTREVDHPVPTNDEIQEEAGAVQQANPRPPKVHPPSLFFQVRLWDTRHVQRQARVFVTDEHFASGLRVGEKAHMLRPYTVDEDGRLVVHPKPKRPVQQEPEDDHAPFHPEYCVLNEDYVVPPSNDNPNSARYYEINKRLLRERCREAERLDFDFAQKMQGLLAVPQTVVWTCLDTDFDPLDRSPLLQVDFFYACCWFIYTV